MTMTPNTLMRLSSSHILACLLDHTVANCVQLQVKRSVPRARCAKISCREQLRGLVPKLDRRCLTVAVLPKTLYLVRTLTIPKVSPRQVFTVLSLEVEASLPPEFGEADISYRRLPDESDENEKYEVYISRREALASYLSSLADMGIRPGLLLPSAVVWAKVLNEAEGLSFIVACVNSTGQTEVALRREGSAVSVRTLKLSQRHDSSGLDRGIAECIREMLGSGGRDSSRLKVGWIGNGCPSLLLNGHVVFEEMNHLFPRGLLDDNAKEIAEPLCYLAAASLLDGDCRKDMHTASLLPRDVTLRRRERLLYKRLAVGVGLTLLSIILVYMALQIAVFRYRRAGSEILGRASLIRAKGESIGRRMAQLSAIRSARLTHRDFYDVIWGLHEASPSGVTYHRAVLTKSGQISLRGKAESVSLPFLLPERLERQPMFAEAALQSVGQRRAGEGSITEFSLRCRLVRNPK